MSYSHADNDEGHVSEFLSNSSSERQNSLTIYTYIHTHRDRLEPRQQVHLAGSYNFSKLHIFQYILSSVFLNRQGGGDK